MTLRLLITSLLFSSQVFAEYPEVVGQYVAPPGLPPAMAPYDHDFKEPQQDGYTTAREQDSNDLLTTTEYTVDYNEETEKPEGGGAQIPSTEEDEGGSGEGVDSFQHLSSGEESEEAVTESSGVESSGEVILEGREEGSTEKSAEGSGEGSGANETMAEASGEMPEGEGMEMHFHDLMNDMAQVAQSSGIACPADVLFVIDSTSSVKGVFESYKEYVAKVIEGLTVSADQDHIGVILFSGPRSHREKIKLGQINNPGKLIDAVKSLPFLSGITATGAALNFATSSLASRRKGIPTVVAVLTDGFSYDLTATAAEHMRDLEGVSVYTVSFGSPRVDKELESIAGDKKRFLKGETSYAQLVNIIKSCPGRGTPPPKVQTVTVKYITTATDSSGRHLIPNPVIGRKGFKHFDDKNGTDANVVRPPAITQNITIKEDRREDVPEPSCQNDIVIVFDASGSTRSNFSVQLALASEIVDKFSVGENATQFAAIKYSAKTKCRVLFNFNQLHTKKDIQRKIKGISFNSGITATNEALMKAVDLFKGPNARKGQAKPILILFTDGFSSESPIKGATYLHHMGVNVFVIGVGDKPEHVYMEELNMIASDTHHVYLLSAFDKFLVDLELIGRNCTV